MKLCVLPRFLACLAVILLLASPGDSATRAGDRLMAEGKRFEDREQWDEALRLYRQAYDTDPTDWVYRIAVMRTSFRASQSHIVKGRELRSAGQADQALAEFEIGLAISPASRVAEQEIQITLDMIRAEEAREKAGEPAPATHLTPAAEAKQRALERFDTAQDVPVLRPLSRDPITLKINNQTPKVLYETVAKLAGINAIFDPDFLRSATTRMDFEVSNATLEEALDYLAVHTKAYWKPLSENTIFITLDNPTKRRDYEEHVVKIFYLENVTSVQELQEIGTAVRAVTDLRKLFTYNSQNAIVVRGPVDRVALAEKIIYDLDKPKAEVVVDVVVLEAARGLTRDLGMSLLSGSSRGLSATAVFRPQASGGDNGGGTTSGTSAGSIPIGQIGRVSSNDWSVTLPSGIVEALLNTRQAQILQAPQVRSLDGQKATLKLGDRVPIASGSFTAGVGAVGVSPLVNTQFQYIDVGVLVDLTPKIHSTDEVSVHVELEISTVRERINVGGLEQPVIGQRRVVHDIRIREGETNLLGGLMQEQDTKTVNGLPWISSVPVLGRFFSTERIERNESELLIALIPHVVRTPDIRAVNLRGIASGNEQNIQLRYYPPASAAQPAAPAKPEPAPAKPQPDAQIGGIAAGPPAALTLTGPEAAVPVSNPFQVELRIENAADLFAAPLRIRFDPMRVQLNDVLEGDLLSQDGQRSVFTKNIRNDAGEAIVNLNRPPGSGGVSDSGVLIRMNFQAIAAGEAQVEIDQLTLRNSKLQAIQANSPSLTVAIE